VAELYHTSEGIVIEARIADKLEKVNLLNVRRKPFCQFSPIAETNA